jgi:UV DNA damage endonuclease
MFKQDIQRIGFACKYMHPDQTQKPKILKEIQYKYTEAQTTVAWLKRQTTEVAEQKMWDIMEHNIQSMYNLIEWVGNQPEHLRMVRLGSNQLPMYTQPDFRYFWQKPDVREVCAKGYGRAGEIARKLDVRVSMHPGQFCVLASDRPDVVERSIEEFEYHADIIRWMGYGKNWQDFKCNVHISGRQGPAGIKAVLPRLSREARNCITIENDEMSWGVDASLELEKEVALVLDIHHHWVRTGEYILPSDDRVRRIKDSWRGVRPAMHYSQCREDLLVDHSAGIKPDMETLLEAGYKKQKLRAHSDFMWNDACNEWAAQFNKDFDIMVEAKCKNLASSQLLAEKQKATKLDSVALIYA